MVMSPAGLGTKDEYAGEDQQKFTQQIVGGRSWRLGVLSCIVRRLYQASTSEDMENWEDLAFEVVICRVWKSVGLV
jgi:hypothetical protein